MSKLERLRKLAQKEWKFDHAQGIPVFDDFKEMSQALDDLNEMHDAFPGLLKVCDAYVASETELRYLKKDMWQKDNWEVAKQEAEARLEELLG